MDKIESKENLVREIRKGWILEPYISSYRCIGQGYTVFSIHVPDFWLVRQRRILYLKFQLTWFLLKLLWRDIRKARKIE